MGFVRRQETSLDRICRLLREAAGDQGAPPETSLTAKKEIKNKSEIPEDGNGKKKALSWHLSGSM